jgi:erythromycin esterase-like protein
MMRCFGRFFAVHTVKMKISIEAALVLLFGFALPYPANASDLADSADGIALTAVTRDVCHRQVVMLGESATHGDGHTEAFKVALVERLVNECGFDSVFFEASHYEFINIARRLRTGQAVSVDQLSSAVGGPWKFDREFQPVLPFLLAKGTPPCF